MPAPYRLRHTRACAMRSAEDTNTDPTGAPSPFDRQTDTVSKPAASSARVRPLATAAFHSRAPSRCSAEAVLPGQLDHRVHRLRPAGRCRPPKLWVFSSAIAAVETR